MQNEKQNKNISTLIDEMQQLPVGFAFNSHAVWNTLEQQLPQKKRSPIIWYYAAAAVLFIAGTVYFTATKNRKQLLNEQTVVTGNTSPKRLLALPSVIQQKNNSSKQTMAITPLHKKAAKQILTIPADKKEVDELVVEQSQQVISPVATPTTVLPVEQTEKKNTLILTTIKPVPKKYKIVHLNDLVTPQTEDQKDILSKYELKKNLQQNEEKEILSPAENTKQILFFKIKPSKITTTTIVEN